MVVRGGLLTRVMELGEEEDLLVVHLESRQLIDVHEGKQTL